MLETAASGFAEWPDQEDEAVEGRSVEYAAGSRNYPSMWGVPEGRADSEERTRWVFKNIGRHGTRYHQGNPDRRASTALAIVAELREL